MSKYKLLQGDCLELMKKLPDKSVDLVLADLPYGTTKNDWDSVIPFDALWNEYMRIVKDRTPIILFGSQPFTTNLISSNISWFREELIWVKNKAGSGLHAKKRHLKTHESIIVFSKKGGYCYNPIKWNVTEKQFLTQRKTFSVYGNTNNNYGSFKRKRKEDDGTRYPISLLPFKVPITAAKSKTYSSDVDLAVHPTQKPVDLLEYLIKTYSNEDDLVLDNTMGSGSTGVAALNTNRNFIGMELEQKYFDIAEKRLTTAKQQVEESAA